MIKRNEKGQFVKGFYQGFGFKYGNHPKTQFKKGQLSWNKGIHKKLNNALEKWREKYTKEKHYNWKGGISENVHSLCEPRYKKWRLNVFERDNYTCQKCRKKGIYLEAHHIKGWAKYPKLRYVLSNGLTLCKPCHEQTDNYRGKRLSTR